MPCEPNDRACNITKKYGDDVQSVKSRTEKSEAARHL